MPDKSIFVVAEVGINHNGDFGICKELIDVAKSAGCDAVKFQKRTVEGFMVKSSLIHIERALGEVPKEFKRKL